MKKSLSLLVALTISVISLCSCGEDNGEEGSIPIGQGIKNDNTNIEDTVEQKQDEEMIQKGWVIATEKRYDEGVLMSETEYFNNGIVRSRKDYTYHSDGSIFYVNHVENDENGNETRSVSYGKDGNIVEGVSREYDDAGNVTKEYVYDRLTGGVNETYTYEYDALNRLV